MNKTLNWQIGIDEVGRGPVAGPVCVGIVALPMSVGIYTNYYLENKFDKIVDKCGKVPLVRGQAEGLGVVKVLGVASDAHQSNILPDTLGPKLRDSKKTTAKFRYQVFSKVDELSAEYLILQASPELIDSFGIAVCIRHLMLVSLIGLSISNSELINDSQIFLDGTLKFQDEYNLELLNSILDENKEEFRRLNLDLKLLEKNLKPDKILDFIKNISGENNSSENIKANPRIIMENFADDKYFAVALASNLAKYFRDEIMIKEGLKYPNYFLDKNMGYGTAKHMLAIKENGLKMIHRKSFLKKYLPEN
jgi:ribonuclease HII